MGFITKQSSETNIFVYITVALFGIGSWVAINGLWVELPIMVPHLPEGWKLPSYLVIITQIANVGPIIVTLLYVFARNKISDKVIVYILVVIGTIACLLLAFFWNRTSYIAGDDHSTALLVLQFWLATVDCTSSVVFLPFMAIFKDNYMTAYFIGEGLSGLVPSLVALGQGVGKVTCENVTVTNTSTNATHHEIQPVYHDPTFPVEHFFFFLFSMMLLCGFAFTLLNFAPYCKKEHVTRNGYDLETVSDSSDSPNSHEMVHESNKFNNPSEAGQSQVVLINEEKKKKQLSVCSTLEIEKQKIPLSKFVYFLVLIGFINAVINGVLPSIQTYSCLPYGNEAYHLAVTLSSIANPVACCIAFFLPVNSSLAISVVTFAGMGISGFIMYTALESPSMVTTAGAGAGIVVTCWVLTTLLLTFAKVSIAGLFRIEGKKALLWCGAITQAGSMVGAIILYVLVNVVVLFQSAPTCPS